MATESARDGMRGGIEGGAPLVVVRVPPGRTTIEEGAMLRRRLAAAALAGVMAAPFAMPGFASGTQAGEQTVSDYFKVKPGKFKVEVRKAGSNQVLAKANNLKLPSGSISSLVAVGGIGEKAELLDIRAAAAVSATGFAVQQRRSSG
jgi:hypothetical protein